jgi:NAD(P)-dependent dehydrogenase (short-subunit alcohol dehydrogenase family)
VNIKGKHAVVTGASRGIGLAIAQALAAAGATVTGVSRAQADVGREAEVREAFAAARAANGPIDILVNNAGVVESATLARTTPELWDRIIATNLTGAFLCSREVINEMVDAKWGRIVNIASTAGLAGAPYISAYCASKHGVVGFTRAVAAEIATSGVTMNAVCPGYTETAILQQAVANIRTKTGRDEAVTRELLAQSNPEGRIAGVEEVAHAVMLLVEGTQNGVAMVVPGFSLH